MMNRNLTNITITLSLLSFAGGGWGAEPAPDWGVRLNFTLLFPTAKHEPAPEHHAK